MSKRTFLLILILATGAFLRFYQIAEIPPGLYPDEAMNGNNALEALATGDFKIFYPENNGREGLFINLQALSLWLFGNEPWALRLVSAIFGTLTILGVYLLAKELFAEKSEARNPKYETNPNDQNQNVNNRRFRISIFEFRISHGETIALLSSFFLAVSYWHINFSRIGFRAIMVPFLATFAMYFLLKELRLSSYSSSEVARPSAAIPAEGLGIEKLPNEKSYGNFSTGSKSIIYLTLAGAFIGLGFHTYIAFRFMPFVLLVPLVWYLWKWWKRRDISGSPTSHGKSDFRTSASCAPCAVLLFLFITFVTALPLGFYFLQNPQDFIGRAGDVSIFSAQSPLTEFLKSSLATIGMFFIRGDCNWRHNLACNPQLYPIVAFFFLIGLIFLIGNILRLRNTKNLRNYENGDSEGQLSYIRTNSYFVAIFFLAWLFFLSLPATLTREGLPHALRSIGMIPPVMILSGLGAWWIYQKTQEWLESKKNEWSIYAGQLERIKKEVLILSLLILLLVPIMTYRNYFARWASNENTYFSFSTDVWHLGQYLRGLPPDTKKYIVVNQAGTDVRGIPMPAQTVMFATDSFRETERERKNIKYVLPRDISNQLSVINNRKTVIAFLNGEDRDLILDIQKKFPALSGVEGPEFKIKIPGDFVILEN